MTSPEPTRPTTPTPAPPPAGPDAALYDAVAAEHAIIYGYGLVSAHSPPDINYLVADAMAAHRKRREASVATLTAHSVPTPLAALGYQLPFPVKSSTDAAKLAVQMENDAAVAWRAVIEQAATDQDRAFGVAALTQSAVLAAQWKKVLGSWPITEALPGGSE